MKRILLATLLTACTLGDVGESASSPATPADAQRVFDTPKSQSNPLALTGIWESAQPAVSGPIMLASRFEFRADFVVIAARCTRDGVAPVIVGGRAEATVNDSLIQTKAAVSDRRPIGAGAECQAASNAGAIPVCDPNTAPISRNVCFELTGTTLDMYQGPGVIKSFNKIAD